MKYRLLEINLSTHQTGSNLGAMVQSKNQNATNVVNNLGERSMRPSMTFSSKYLSIETPRQHLH